MRTSDRAGGGPVRVADAGTRDTRVGARIPSDTCTWEDLCTPYLEDPNARTGLELAEGWTRRWTAVWWFGKAEVVSPVHDMAQMPLGGARPVRGFSFSTAQRHRPSLSYADSTGHLHGCESFEEARVLLALDFAGDVGAVLSQPFRLKYGAAGRMLNHTPDFLAVTRTGRWLIDVRPAGRIEPRDRVAFAAAAEAALACGWRYTVATGFPPQVFTTLDDISQRRRPFTDHFGLEPALLETLGHGPRCFGDWVTATALPEVARAHAVRLIWCRRVGIDVSAPLTDRSMVWAAGGAQ